MSDFLGAVKRILFAVLTAFKKELESGGLQVGKAKDAQKLNGKSIEDIKSLITQSSNSSFEKIREVLTEDNELILFTEDKIDGKAKTQKQLHEMMMEHMAIQDKKIKILSDAILAFK